MTRSPLLAGLGSVFLAISAALLFTRCSLTSEPESSPVLECPAASTSEVESRSTDCSDLTNQREAQLLAVWLTGKLRPDPSLTGRFCRELKHLRERFADQYPVVESRFRAAWVSRELTVKFTDPAATALREGRYDGWLGLRPTLRPDTLLRPPNKINWGTIGFDDVFHMGRMATHYEEKDLPGVLDSEPNLIGHFGFGTFPILPMWNGETLGLVFTGGSSMSPSHFFRICNGQAKFVDTRKRGEAAPRWLQEAAAAWDRRKNSTS